ncbi:MAG: AGE family epimerase/isomerase [Pseudomonadota bacterium]
MPENFEHASPRPLINPALRQSAQRLGAWMAMALPLWADRAQLSDGSWVEHLQLDGTPDYDAERRWRVIGRQAVAYAQATLAGWHDGTQTARRSFDVYWSQGWTGTHMVHRIAGDGTVSDGRHDLYDHAFALLACARMLQLTGDAVYRDRARDVTDYLARHAHPSGGWHEGAIKPSPRRQNPHMHLLEASLALYEATGSVDDLSIADAVITLFDDHFHQEGLIREFFTHDWSADPALGDQVEPGHAVEWVWLLRRYEMATGRDRSAARVQLYDRAFRQRLGRLYDAERRDGTIDRQTTRLWVQTEAVKAHLAMADTGHPGADGMAAASIDALFGSFLRQDGLWNDQLNACDAVISQTIPVSTLYHIVGMAVEADRLSEPMAGAIGF